MTSHGGGGGGRQSMGTMTGRVRGLGNGGSGAMAEQTTEQVDKGRGREGEGGKRAADDDRTRGSNRTGEGDSAKR